MERYDPTLTKGTRNWIWIRSESRSKGLSHPRAWAWRSRPCGGTPRATGTRRTTVRRNGTMRPACGCTPICIAKKATCRMPTIGIAAAARRRQKSASKLNGKAWRDHSWRRNREGGDAPVRDCGIFGGVSYSASRGREAVYVGRAMSDACRRTSPCLTLSRAEPGQVLTRNGCAVEPCNKRARGYGKLSQRDSRADPA
jgi:hypothetical protein